MILFWESKKNHPQVYLGECKYKIKKTQMPKFIKNELKSDSDLDWDSKKNKKFGIDRTRVVYEAMEPYGDQPGALWRPNYIILARNLTSFILINAEFS